MKRHRTPFWTRFEIWIETLPDWLFLAIAGTIFLAACTPLFLGAAWLLSYVLGWGACR